MIVGNPPKQHVDGDLPCISCNYNLRTLSVAGVCPECGQPVLRSIRRALRDADLKWLKVIRRGAGILAWTWVGAALIVLAWVVGGPHFWGAGPAKAVVMPWASGLALFAYTIGSLLFTAREPDTQPPRQPSVIGAIRACPAALALALLLGYARLVTIDTLFVELILMAWVVLVAIHARRLARRGGDKNAARFATHTLWDGPAAYVATALIGMPVVVGMYGSWSEAQRGISEILLLHLAFLPLWIAVAGVFHLVLMFVIRGTLREVIANRKTIYQAGIETPGGQYF